MINRFYNKAIAWIERERFVLLLLCTVLTMVLPAFSGSGKLSEIIFVITLSFLFIQSMVVANAGKPPKTLIKLIVVSMIAITCLKPIGYDSVYAELIKLTFFTAFFIFVISYLIRFVSRTPSVNVNVLITSINIYLLVGIVGATLSLAFYHLYPNAYTFPQYIQHPVFVHFLYYSFITMSTVGYGDIAPCIPETQTLAYLMSITGQLYVAIIIAFLIGKLLMKANENKPEQTNRGHE